MRIGIDIDDTINNFNLLAIKHMIEHKKNIGEPLPEKYDVEDYAEYFDGDKEKCNAYFTKYYMTIVEECTLNADVKDLVKKLKEDGHTICIVTVRRAKEPEFNKAIQESTINWLKRHGVDYDELYLGVKKKGEFCKENNIDILFDDRIENIEDALKHDVKVCLAMSFHNLNYENEKVKKIYQFTEFYEHIRSLNQK